MLKIIAKTIRKIKDPGSQGNKRSPEWEKVRKEWLDKNPACAACGKTEKDHVRINVHHIKQFSKFPELELDPDNLITLCEGKKTINDHLYWGHGENFKQENTNVVEDVKYALEMLKRTKSGK